MTLALTILLFVVAFVGGVLLRLFSKRWPATVWLIVHALAPLLAAAAIVLAIHTWTSLAGAAPRDKHWWVASSSGALLSLAGCLLWGRARPVVAGLLCFGLIGFLWADLIYFRFFGNIIPLLALGSATHLWDVRDSIATLIEPWDIIWPVLAGVGLCTAALWWLPREVAIAAKRARRRWGVIVAAVMLVAALPFVIDLGVWADKNKQNFYDRGRTVGWVGIVGAHARDVVRVWRERERLGTLDDALVEDTRARMLARRASWPARSELDGALAGTNLLFVQLEGVQHWVLDAVVAGREVTPFLSRLRDRSLAFEQIYDQTGSGRTSDCEYLVNNSLHPVGGGSVAIRRAGNTFVTIGTTLADLGWDTFSAHGYHRGFWNRAVVHPRYGYSRSFFRKELLGEPEMGWGISDKAFLTKVAQFAAESKKPFYGYAITLTSHHPYNYVPEDEQTLIAGALENTELGDYLNSMRYLDEAVADLFVQLGEVGLAEDTTVVLFGDHDSRLRLQSREERVARHALGFDRARMRSIAVRGWRTDLLPLLIVPPEGSGVEPQSVQTVGGLIDIGPTVLRLVGVEPPLSFVGRPLLPSRRGGTAARIDGAAATDDVIWATRGRGGCASTARRARKVAPIECEPLRAAIADELELSDRITMFDLASRMSPTLDEARTPPTLAD